MLGMSGRRTVMHKPLGAAAPTGWMLVGFWFLLLLPLLLVLPRPSAASPDVREAIVKIYCVENRSDYDNPWNRLGPQTWTGSGAIMSGQRIITNAHVVSDQTFLQVRRYGQARKYTARIVAIAHDADVALLTVDDPAFFAGVTPLALGPLPQVQDDVLVYGFPEGGDTLSATRGVISRIEHHAYTHSALSLLAAPLDAAINAGNSGGPVVVDGRMAGVAMQGLADADNIGYLIPAPVIQHVLTDMADGRYDGFPELGIHTQALDNASLKRRLRVPNDVSGVLITQIVPGTPAHGQLRPGDVLVAVDGQAVADDGSVEFRPYERTHFDYYIQRHQVGEVLRVEIVRSGQPATLTVPLHAAWGTSDLVPRWRYGTRPSYYLYGGLVFCPLSLDYLRTWGKAWYHHAPVALRNYYQHGALQAEGEEVVVLIKVLSSELNTGYQDLVNQRIIEVNDQKIKNLRELAAIVDQSIDEFIVFKTEQQRLIVLDREQARAKSRQIAQTYDIPIDRSPDLRPRLTAN
jgi:S1-C subfamily serine protease